MKVTIQNVRGAVTARLRRVQKWRGQRHPATIEQGIEELRANWDLPPADDEPVFVLACGWRSGSTFLQRLVIGAGRDLIWGEPYPQADLLGSLARGLRGFAHGPEPRRLLSHHDDHSPDGLSAGWVANLYPDPSDFIEAQRALFRRLYAEPARAAGFSGWGIKEVRYGFPEASYLHLLFPRAKFVFLHRNPYDSWYSFASGHRGSTFRPDQRVWTATQYGRVWNTLAGSVIDQANHVDGLVVRYDDLASGEAAAALETYLGLSLPFDRLAEPVGSTAWGRSPANRFDVRRLARQVEPLAGSLGYRPPR